MGTLVSLESRELRYIGVALHNPDRVTIPAGLTIVNGPNGAGKSAFGRIVAHGRNFMTNVIRPLDLNVRLVEFNDAHSLSGFTGQYRQQRYESMMNDGIPFVKELLGTVVTPEIWNEWSTHFNIRHIPDKRINYLSSGETRKLLLLKALSASPDLLILDNPYIGLDTESREILDEAITTIISHGISVMLLVADRGECRLTADMELYMREMTIHRQSSEPYCASIVDVPIPQGQPSRIETDSIVEMNGCSISYGDRPLLKDIHWEIKAGERWSLSGPNGSGKSTLLSMIVADHPQAYSNPVRIFGQKRGHGQSIWDIKRHIGYLSPEFHLYFRTSATAHEVVAGGLIDFTGGFIRPDSNMLTQATQWLEAMGLTHLKERPFNTLSNGEQRLVLLARTFIKKPQLLILDEPFHGLDPDNRAMATRIIEHLSYDPLTATVIVTHQPSHLQSSINRHKTLSACF